MVYMIKTNTKEIDMKNTKEVTMDKIDDMINDRAYTGVIWNTDDNVLYKWSEINVALVKMGLSPDKE